MKTPSWYKKFLAARKRKNFSHRLVGGSKPEVLQRSMTKRQKLAAAKRFAKDGETENARQMALLACPKK